MDLLASEVRVLGSLLEKQRTTPDAYPLTLNSLRLACNQSTNRDPVVRYSEADLRDAVQRLERRGLVRFASGAGSRAAKFRHLLPERLPMDEDEQAVMCVLMLRGAQTPGELKQRGERLHPFPSLLEVQQTLERLIDRELVTRMPRRPGQKEERYAHLLGAGEQPLDSGSHAAGEREPAQPAVPSESSSLAQAASSLGGTAIGDRGAGPSHEEMRELRQRVSKLERELAGLKAELGVGASG